jgi:long-chain acyl-CoA synthetase
VKSPKKLIDQSDKSIRTVYDSVIQSFTKREQLLCAGRRKKLDDGKWGPFEFHTYKEVRKIFEDFAAGLRSLGVEPRTHLGVYSKNRPEWLYTYLAACSQAIVLVPLYDTLGPEATTYVINHASIEIVVSSLENLPKLIGVAAGEKTQFKRVILMDPFTQQDAENAQKVGLKLLSFSEVIALGNKNPVPAASITPDDLLIIMYTSGTTGVPKGVMITHRNMVASLSALPFTNSGIREGDVHLSYLPLAHIMEFAFVTFSIHEGGTIGFWRGVRYTRIIR